LHHRFAELGWAQDKVRKVKKRWAWVSPLQDREILEKEVERRLPAMGVRANYIRLIVSETEI
jgi:hypothetical protein